MAPSFAPLQQITLSGEVTDLDLSNDGTLLAVAIRSPKGKAAIQIYRTDDGSLVEEFAMGKVMGRGVKSKAAVERGRGVAFADKALYAMVQLESPNLELWRIPIGKGAPEAITQYELNQCHSLVRDRSGRLLAVVGETLQIWDLKKHEVARHITHNARNHQFAACFAADRPAVYIAGREPSMLVLHDLTTGRDDATWTLPFEYAKQVLASADGRIVAAVGEHLTGAVVLDTKTKKPLLAQVYDPAAFTSLFGMMPGYLIGLTSDTVAYALPKLKEEIHGEVVPADRTWASASAWEARVTAFGFDAGQLAWVRLVD